MYLRSPATLMPVAPGPICFNLALNRMRDYNIDEIDSKILAALSRDARVQHQQLARECGITRQTVSTRIKRLEKDGIIRKYRAAIDYDMIGLRSFFVLFLKLDTADQAASGAFIAALKADPHVLMDASITGEWDVVLLLAFRDVKEYESYISRLRQQLGPALKDSKSHVVLDFYKTMDDWALS
ncbi:MAG: putative HTH-type transcriptional regulator [Methanocella sp. PtaU1.Bin125]|nr:MAG: putative HTH-type transcriptional regulator [Methanocella sp. PtaU1.Bin125]